MNLRITCLVLPIFLNSCYEVNSTADKRALEQQATELEFNIRHTRGIIEDEKTKLAAYQQMIEDQRQLEELSAAKAEGGRLDITAVAENNWSLANEIKQLQEDLQSYQKSYRSKVRKAGIGKVIDLSASQGEGFEKVKIMSITPVGINVVTASGPKFIEVRGLTPVVREMFDMSEEEAAAYRQRKQEAKEKQLGMTPKEKEKPEGKETEDPKVTAFQADLFKKIYALKTEIERREDAIKVQMEVMRAWKTKASTLELESARAKNISRKRSLMTKAENAREEATEIADKNSNGWIVIRKLKAQLEILKEKKKR